MWPDKAESIRAFLEQDETKKVRGIIRAGEEANNLHETARVGPSELAIAILRDEIISMVKDKNIDDPGDVLGMSVEEATRRIAI